MRNQTNKPARLLAALILLFCSGTQTVCHAQLRGHHLLLDYGLAAGTQPPPSISVFPILYWYSSSRIITSDGDVLHTPDLRVFLTGVGGSVVTNLRILNANYGFAVFPAFTSERIEGNRFEEVSPLGLTDLFVQPIQLGWHTRMADFQLGYNLYLPIGKYEFAGEHNMGLGMLTNEFFAGATLYFNEKKTYNISSIVFYEIHGEKEGTEVRTGDLLTAQGGLARTFYIKRPAAQLPMSINIGLVYYLQFKMTNDRIPIGNQIFTGRKDHVYALGAEANVLLPKSNTSVVFRWAAEFEARNRFEGNTFFLTLSQVLKELEVKEK